MFATGRGGQITYHGPGQRVAYVMLDLKQRRPDVRAYVAGLEEWIIRTLAAFNVRGERREDRVGVWVSRPDKGEGFEDKIAAIGVRLRRWVSFHGISINVEPDLTHFDAIVPCGVADPRYGVTSLVDLGHPVSMADVDIALRQAFQQVFGAVESGCRRRASDGGMQSSRRMNGAGGGRRQEFGSLKRARPRRRTLASSRRALRRDVELARDVAPLLRQPAKAVGIAADFVDVDITLVVQRPQQIAHAPEHRGEIVRLFVLGVGAFGDMDVEPEARKLLFGQRAPAREPVRRIDGPHDDGGDLRDPCAGSWR